MIGTGKDPRTLRVRSSSPNLSSRGMAVKERLGSLVYLVGDASVARVLLRPPAGPKPACTLVSNRDVESRSS